MESQHAALPKGAGDVTGLPPADVNANLSRLNRAVPARDLPNVSEDGKPRALDSLLESAPILVGLAALITIVVYMIDPITVRGAESTSNQWNGFWQPLHNYGNYVAIVAGIAVAILMILMTNTRLANARQSNPRQFSEIRLRHDTLATRKQYLEQDMITPDNDHVAKGALTEAEKHLTYVCRQMMLDGPSDAMSSMINWQLGIGYLEMWLRVHRAEEAICLAEQPEQAVANLEYDRLRLKGSAVPNRNHLVTLADNAIQNWRTDPRAENAGLGTRFTSQLLRLELNVFRDIRRDGLVQTRYRIMWTGMVTGLVGYALLVLAMLFNPGRSAVATAAALFLVAAVVGLFSQLHQASGVSAQTLEDDFGVTRARLAWTPLLSGFAGVAGVVLMAMFAPVLEQVSAGDSFSEVPSLSAIFDLTNAPFALVIAAVFGLTPGLVINRLQGEANQLKAEFSSTSTTADGTGDS